uniref:Uncharacterized protein n=1 Tax=Rhizophora mucronata TaxID=61149 RepID=A0A2P2NJ40_RHIMU
MISGQMSTLLTYAHLVTQDQRFSQLLTGM